MAIGDNIISSFKLLHHDGPGLSLGNDVKVILAVFLFFCFFLGGGITLAVDLSIIFQAMGFQFVSYHSINIDYAYVPHPFCQTTFR
jgi:hypothetical protein